MPYLSNDMSSLEMSADPELFPAAEALHVLQSWKRLMLTAARQRASGRSRGRHPVTASDSAASSHRQGAEPASNRRRPLSGEPPEDCEICMRWVPARVPRLRWMHSSALLS